MWYLFLDESGDLGFDFVNKKPSRFFTICLLATSDVTTYYAIRKAIKKTLARKVNKNGRAKNLKQELKGVETTQEAKKHFYAQIAKLQFGIYSLTLNKKRVFERLTREKERVYNHIARKVMDNIPFEQANQRVQLVVDRCKGKAEIREFNDYIIRQLEGRLSPSVPLNIDHLESHQEPALQAVDLFAWGIFRKYEKDDKKWFDAYKEKMRLDEIFLG